MGRDPSHIMQVGMGFWPSKTVLSAVELELFTHLGSDSITGEALRSGKPQNEVKHNGQPMFEELYSDPARLEQFMAAMAGISRGNFEALAQKFDFSKYRTVCDVGGASGQLSTIL